MKIRPFFLISTAFLLSVFLTHTAVANGFFQDDAGTSINDSYSMDYMPLDNFINEERNPHNYYNPFKLNAADGLENKQNHFAYRTLSSAQQTMGESLEHKSEQAIKSNNRSTADEPVMQDMHSSGTNLSQLTSSSLILSARKKQFFQKSFSVLLSHQDIISVDRERLERLAENFQHNRTIDAVDEDWLRRLVNEYNLSAEQTKPLTLTPMANTH